MNAWILIKKRDRQGCIRREGTSEVAPEAVGQAVGGGCRSGWGRLLLVTNAIEAGTCRQGDSGWALAGRPGGGGGLFQCIPGDHQLVRARLNSCEPDVRDSHPANNTYKSQPKKQEGIAAPDTMRSSARHAPPSPPTPLPPRLHTTSALAGLALEVRRTVVPISDNWLDCNTVVGVVYWGVEVVAVMPETCVNATKGSGAVKRSGVGWRGGPECRVCSVAVDRAEAQGMGGYGAVVRVRHRV